MGLFQFLKSKFFFKHLAITLLIIGVVIWLTFKFLSIYTLHGETILVPDFKGVKITELDKFIDDKHIRYLIIDSIYDNTKPQGIVLRQDPSPNTPVKNERTIYLSVTSMLPPQINMPKLQDKSLRQAAATIETYGLKLGKIKYVPDQCANCVLQQLYKGKKIQPGTSIEKNSIIDLVVGKGLSDEEVPVPYLIGLTRDEALEKLAEASLNEGTPIYDNPKDSLKSRVYKQIPGPSKDRYVNMGSSIDLFLTTDDSKLNTPSDTTDTETTNGGE